MSDPVIRILSRPEGARLPPTVVAFVKACDAMPDFAVDTTQAVCKAAGIRSDAIKVNAQHPAVTARRISFGQGAQTYCGNPTTIAWCRENNWTPGGAA